MKIETSAVKQYRLDKKYYHKMGLLESNRGKVYSIHNLPDNLTVKGSLDLSHNNLTSLPENLEIEKSLILVCNNLTFLPEGLKVGGYLYLKRNNFPKNYKIPDTVGIGGKVYW